MKKAFVFVAAVAAAGTVLAAGLGPQSYVQDGLVTHFDAIDNEGTGTYNPSAATWRDLKGSAYITLQSGASWTGRYFDSTATQHTIKAMPAYNRTSLTMEVPINVISNGISSSGSYPRIFANGESFSIYFERTGSTACLYFNGQNPDTRPNFGSFRMGTVFVFGSSECYGIGLNGLVKSQTSVPVKVSVTKPAADWVLNGNSGYLHGHYYGLRFYNRYLTSDELKANAAVDSLRFFSYAYTGTGAPENWSDLAWAVPEKATGIAPSTLTNEYAQIANATVGRGRRREDPVCGGRGRAARHLHGHGAGRHAGELARGRWRGARGGRAGPGRALHRPHARRRRLVRVRPCERLCTRL